MSYNLCVMSSVYMCVGKGEEGGKEGEGRGEREGEEWRRGEGGGGVGTFAKSSSETCASSTL